MNNVIKFASREYRLGAKNAREEIAQRKPISELMDALAAAYEGDDYDKGYYDELCREARG